MAFRITLHKCFCNKMSISHFLSSRPVQTFIPAFTVSFCEGVFTSLKITCFTNPFHLQTFPKKLTPQTMTRMDCFFWVFLYSFIFHFLFLVQCSRFIFHQLSTVLWALHNYFAGSSTSSRNFLLFILLMNRRRSHWQCCEGGYCHIRHRACQAVYAAGRRALIVEQQLRHV